MVVTSFSFLEVNLTHYLLKRQEGEMINFCDIIFKNFAVHLTGKFKFLCL